MRQKKKERATASESKGKKSARMLTPMEALIFNLGSHDDVIRVKARHALVAFGKAAVPPLIEALKSEHYLIRWEAAKALGEIADPGAAPALVKALEDEEFDVRWLAGEGLINMNINGLRPLLQALEHRGDSALLREGAHHVFHDLAKGGLRKFLSPVLAALEALEPGEEVPWAASHEMKVEVPWAARHCLDMLEQAKKLLISSSL